MAAVPCRFAWRRSTRRRSKEHHARQALVTRGKEESDAKCQPATQVNRRHGVADICFARPNGQNRRKKEPKKRA